MSFIRRASRVAVASSIHGNIQRRQRTRWAQQEQATVPQPPVAADPPSHMLPQTDILDQLAKLGELKTAGILTDAEFDAQKARILAG
jgi:hypothetical protein